MPVGYIVLMYPKKMRQHGFGAPMAYGSEGDPSPELLLRDRGATLFESEREASDALSATLKKAEADGCEWPERYTYDVVPCVRSAD